MADLRASKFRHLSSLIRAEREVQRVAESAFAAWLPKVEAAVVGTSALDPGAISNAEEDWDRQIEAILGALLLVWTRRFRANSDKTFPMDSWTLYADQIRIYLRAVPNKVFSKLMRIANSNEFGEVKMKLTREALSPSEFIKHASVIAQTQTISAYNAGFTAGLVSSGVQGMQTWISLRDTHVRATHQAADGQRVPVGAMFTVGGHAARYPGDPGLPPQEAVNCRCVVDFEASPLVAATGDTMPWTVVKGGGTCSDTEWAVIKETDGSTAGCHATETEARAQQRALYASERGADTSSGYTVIDRLGYPNGWRGPIALLDGPTGDGRQLNTPPGGLRTREYPMSVTREHVSQGTDVLIGTIDRSWTDGAMLMGEGRWDLGSEDGRNAARLVAEGMLTTMSIQPDEVTFEQQFVDPDGNIVAYDEAVDPGTDTHGPALKDGYQILDVMTDWRLASTALVSIPAFDQARIEPVWDYVPTSDQPNYSDGSMIALRVQNPENYVVDGGSIAEDLHVTLHYLGKASDLAEDAVGAASRAALVASEMMRKRKRRTAKVAGYGVLGDKGAVVLFLNGGGISDAHTASDAELNNFGREVFAEPHEPFLAHMTLGYELDSHVAAQFVGQELTFSTVSFVHGTNETQYDLAEEDTALVATVVGNLGLPVVSDRKMKWDGHKARVLVAKWASSDGSGDLDKINWSKFGQAFLYRGKPQSGNALYADGGGSGGYRVEDFKLGFATIIDGSLTIVPNGAIGIAGGHGVTATKGIPEAEKTAIKAKLCSLYAKIRKVHTDFPECPFGKNQGASLVAASIADEQVFRSDFFADPKLEGPTPITVTEDGRVYGHVALFGTCYQYGGGANGATVCRMTPKGNDFEEFHVHGAKLEDGSVLPVGSLTFGEGHADHGGLRAAQRAYANVASVAAKIRCGEDQFGIWMAGQMLDSFDGDPSVIMYAPLSGHWEPNLDRRGRLSMIAAHSVVTPGFRVPRLVASIGDDGEIETFATLAPEHTERADMVRLRFAQIRARDALKRIGVS